MTKRTLELLAKKFK
jgi:hypothetical protein